MKKIILIIALALTGQAFSQQKIVKLNASEALTIEVPENGKIENGFYFCNLFNWKIAIPEGYEITDVKRIEELENKGLAKLNDEAPDGIKINPHPTHLIGFEKSKYNTFSASFESLIGKKKFTLEEHKNFSVQLLNDTYSKIKELKTVITNADLKIGKYDFYKITTFIYNAKTEKLLLTQEVYNTFIDDHLFSVLISYTEENVGYVLNYNFINSLK